MADEHPHTGSTLHWGWGQVIRHLKDAHGVSIPMSWTVGQAHDAHLKAHVQGNHAQLDGECQPKKEQPVPDTDDLETLARHLWMENEDKRVPAGWDDLGQETRDHYRDLARVNLAAKRDADNASTAAQRETNRQITRDRLIAAMAGLDFDTSWASDSGIGPSARAAFREQFGKGAERLLTWLTRGGALHLPPVASLAEDLEKEQALVMDMEGTNNDLRAQLAITGRQLEDVKTQLNQAGGEREALRESMNSARAERDDLRAQLRLLTEERDRLDRQLQLALSLKDSEVEKADRFRRERDEMAQDRLHAVASANRLSTEVAGLQDQLHLLQGRWERVVPRLESRLMARTQALKEGRERLHEWEAEIQKAAKEVPGADWLDFDGQKILDRIDQILGKSVPVAEPVGMRPVAVRVSLGDTDISDIRPTNDWEPAPHPYGDSHTGMLCGALVLDEDGFGTECGLPAGHRVHDAPEPTEPGTDPLAEAHQDLLDWARRFSTGEI